MLGFWVKGRGYSMSKKRFTPEDISLFYNRKTHCDSILMLNIEELQLHIFAKVVWTAPVNNKESRAGLRLIWHT